MKVGDKILTKSGIEGYIVNYNPKLLWGFKYRIVITKGNVLFPNGDELELKEEDIDSIITKEKEVDEKIRLENLALIEKLEKKIDKNREEINHWLHKDVDLSFLYMRINMLSAQNESWIKRIKTLKDG